jgi:hypothetical protein
MSKPIAHERATANQARLAMRVQRSCSTASRLHGHHRSRRQRRAPATSKGEVVKRPEAQRIARRIMNRHLEGSAIGPAIISSSWEAMENGVARAILEARRRRR